MAQAAAQRAGLPIGTTVDRYRIEGDLGAGGFGAVYRARHTVIDRPVALKMLRPDRVHAPQVLERFLLEAKAAAAVGSPHIVQVMDAGRTPDGQYFLAMELLEGEDLADRLKRTGSVPPSLAVDITVQILEGLSAAHPKGIVHRDLKPANVFLCPGPDDSVFVKLLDFGISKVRKQNEISSLTQTGMVLGTPHYMAPEQFRGARDVDGRADLYSVAVILFQMLSGRIPYDASSYDALLLKIFSEPPMPLGQVAPQITPGLQRVVDRGLARDPDARFQSALELRQALLFHDGAQAVPKPTALLESSGAQEQPTAAARPSARPPAETHPSNRPGPPVAPGQSPPPPGATHPSGRPGPPVAPGRSAPPPGATHPSGRPGPPVAPGRSAPPPGAIHPSSRPGPPVATGSKAPPVLAAGTPRPSAGPMPATTGTPGSGPQSVPPQTRETPAYAAHAQMTPLSMQKTVERDSQGGARRWLVMGLVGLLCAGLAAGAVIGALSLLDSSSDRDDSPAVDEPAQTTESEPMRPVPSTESFPNDKPEPEQSQVTSPEGAVQPAVGRPEAPSEAPRRPPPAESARERDPQPPEATPGGGRQARQPPVTTMAARSVEAPTTQQPTSSRVAAPQNAPLPAIPPGVRIRYSVSFTRNANERRIGELIARSALRHMRQCVALGPGERMTVSVMFSGEGRITNVGPQPSFADQTRAATCAYQAIRRVGSVQGHGESGIVFIQLTMPGR